MLNRVDRFLAGPVPDRPTARHGPRHRTARDAVTHARITPVPVDPRAGRDADADARPDADPDARARSASRSTSTSSTTPSRSSRPSSTRTGARRPACRWSSRSSAWWTRREATQREIAGRVREWESYDDSHNGDWGPAAMALALRAYGAPGYEVRAFETRSGALRDAAIAIQKTGSPVDPAGLARRAHLGDDRVPGRRRSRGLQEREDGGRLHPRPVVSAGVVDLGPSDPAGTFQDGAEMQRNFLPWKRPEGRYPDRDGLWITVAPTISVGDLRLGAAARPLAPSGGAAGRGRHPPDAPGQHRDQQRRSGPRCRARTTAGSRRTPRLRRQRQGGHDRHDEPDERRADLPERVVRRVDRPAQQVAQALERHRQREHGEDLGRARDVVGAELAAAEQDVDAARAEDDQADRGADGQERRWSGRCGPTRPVNPRRSRAA